MNHVPDDTLAAVDELGRAVLRGTAQPVAEQLRTDLTVRIASDQRDIESGTLPVVFWITGRPRPRLRDHGSYVATIVDGLEHRLVAWGIDPPDRYRHCGSVSSPPESNSDSQANAETAEWHRYTGTARLPRAD